MRPEPALAALPILAKLTAGALPSSGFSPNAIFLISVEGT